MHLCVWEVCAWGFPHLLETIPLKFFKAKDVQDPNFEGWITGTNKQTDGIFRA